MNVVKCRNWTQIRPCYARGHYHLALPPGLIGGGDNRYVSTIRHLVQQKTSTALLPAIFGNTLYTLRLCNLRQSQSSPHREALRKTTSGLLPPRWKTVEIDWASFKILSRIESNQVERMSTTSRRCKMYIPLDYSRLTTYYRLMKYVSSTWLRHAFDTSEVVCDFSATRLARTYKSAIRLSTWFPTC